MIWLRAKLRRALGALPKASNEFSIDNASWAFLQFHATEVSRIRSSVHNAGMRRHHRREQFQFDIDHLQAYHSIFLGDTGVQLIGINSNPSHPSNTPHDVAVGNFPLLPLRTKTRGPAHALPALSPALSSFEIDPDSESYDILDETLSLFRANTFFRNFEIKGPADRLLIYGILFISECLSKVQSNADARSAEKALINGALEQFAIPGDANFPLNQAFEAPADRMQAEQLRGYLSQVRQELAMRLHQRLYNDGSGPSKVNPIPS